MAGWRIARDRQWHLYTPVIAILHIALKEKAPELARPAKHNEVTPVVTPPERWYRDLNPSLNPWQRAFVVTLCMHGRRTGEMLARRPADLRVDAGILGTWADETGMGQLELHPEALKLVLAIPRMDKQRWLFGVGPTAPTASPRPQGRLPASRGRIVSPAFVRPAHFRHPHAARPATRWRTSPTPMA